MIIIFANERPSFSTCAMKTAATASYRAVPSMLMVAPTGSMNLVTLGSAPKLSSRFWIVIGRVAELGEGRGGEGRGGEGRGGEGRGGEGRGGEGRGGEGKGGQGRGGEGRGGDGRERGEERGGEERGGEGCDGRGGGRGRGGEGEGERRGENIEQGKMVHIATSYQLSYQVKPRNSTMLVYS